MAAATQAVYLSVDTATPLAFDLEDVLVLMENEAESHDIVFNQASLHFAMGESKRAVKLVERALQMAQDHGEEHLDPLQAQEALFRLATSPTDASVETHQALLRARLKAFPFAVLSHNVAHHLALV